MTVKQMFGSVVMSSADPNELSMTARGVILGILPVLIFIAKQYELDLDQSKFGAFVDMAFTFVAEVIVLAGLIRKVYYAGIDLFKKSGV